MVSVGEYLVGLVVAVAVVGPLWFAAIRLHMCFGPGWQGALARLSEAIVGVALLLALSQTLGALGLLGRVPLVLGALVIGGGVSITTRERASIPRRNRREHLSPRRRPDARHVATAGGVAVVVCIVATPWIGRTLIALRTGVLGFDSLNYHLPFVARFAAGREHHRASFHDPRTRDGISSRELRADPCGRNGRAADRRPFADHESRLGCLGAARCVVRRALAARATRDTGGRRSASLVPALRRVRRRPSYERHRWVRVAACCRCRPPQQCGRESGDRAGGDRRGPCARRQAHPRGSRRGAHGRSHRCRGVRAIGRELRGSGCRGSCSRAASGTSETSSPSAVRSLLCASALARFLSRPRRSGGRHRPTVSRTTCSMRPSGATGTAPAFAARSAGWGRSSSCLPWPAGCSPSCSVTVLSACSASSA